MESITLTNLLDPQLRKTSELFDTWAQEGRGESMAEGHWPRVSQILEKMRIGSGMRCVDIGCGNGYAVRAMANRVGPEGLVVGVDLSPEMVQRARVLTTEANTEFHQAPAHQLPLEDHRFDRVLSVEVLYYTPDPLETLREWRRILKPGGSLWIMVDFYREHTHSECWGELVGIPMQYLSEADYQRLFEEAGFQGVRTERILDARPVDESQFKPGWGYETVEDVRRFRTEIGSLLVTGHQPG